MEVDQWDVSVKHGVRNSSTMLFYFFNTAVFILLTVSDGENRGVQIKEIIVPSVAFLT